jgi:hypothetical protein
MLSWIEGRLIFDQEDIITVTKRLERWYGVNITVSNPDQNNDLFTFTIDNNTLDEVLELMKKISQFSYIKTEDGINLTFI